MKKWRKKINKPAHAFSDTSSSAVVLIAVLKIS